MSTTKTTRGCKCRQLRALAAGRARRTRHPHLVFHLNDDIGNDIAIVQVFFINLWRFPRAVLLGIGEGLAGFGVVDLRHVVRTQLVWESINTTNQSPRCPTSTSGAPTTSLAAQHKPPHFVAQQKLTFSSENMASKSASSMVFPGTESTLSSGSAPSPELLLPAPTPSPSSSSTSFFSSSPSRSPWMVCTMAVRQRYKSS